MALNLSTEALARASARRPWLVVAAWVAVCAVSVALIFNLLSDALTNEFGFSRRDAAPGRAQLVPAFRAPLAPGDANGAERWSLRLVGGLLR